MTDKSCTPVSVWDLPTRLFHWINFFSVFTLILLGLLMLFRKDLGMSSLDAKIVLKELHVIVGYMFVLNLLWRIVWGFMGNRYARWKTIFPGRGYLQTLRRYLQSVKNGEPESWAGHNPLGRLAVVFLMLLMLVLAVSGLVRAGTDIYYPPFGSSIAAYLAKPGVSPESIKPYDETGVDAAKAEKIKAFKSPFGKLHLWTAYIFMAMILIHILFVILADIRERNGLISAMFTGKKLMRKPARD